jgi:glutaryl-CoA dehydrogenase
MPRDQIDKDAPALAAFDWADPLRLHDQLSEDERMMRDAARAYAQERLAPRAIAAWRDEATDPAIFPEMGEMGLLGITVPEEYGGLGAGYVTYGLVAREIERVDSGYRSMMSVQSSLVMYPIHRLRLRGTAAKIPARLARGALIGCFGLTEPDAGSDPGGMKTRAEDRWRRLYPQRRQDVDLQRPHRRHLRGLGEVRGAWRQDPRLRAGEGHEGACRRRRSAAS